jgi:uncharacterized iron-regulated membrane protein
MKLKTVALTIHRSIGVVLGLVILIISLTGSALVFYRELDLAFHLHLMQVVPQEEFLAPEVVLKNVSSAFPQIKDLHGIIFPRSPSGVYIVMLKSGAEEWLDVCVNPYTGVILGTKTWGHTPMSFIYSIHNSLLAKSAGYKFVGVCGLLFVVLVVTGLVVWPGWRNFRRGFLIRLGSPKPLLTYDFHKVGGFVFALFLLLIASTGAAMVFRSEFESAAYWLTNTSKPIPPVSTIIADQAPLPLGEILHQANTVLPSGQITLVHLPHDANGVFKINKKLPDDIDFYGRSKVYIDQYSGEVLQVENALQAPLAAQMSNALILLHNGAYGGWGMRCLYILIGFVPPALLATGVIMWRNRNRVKIIRN